MVGASTAQTPGIAPSDAPTTMTVTVASRGAVQFDVWIDGKRFGGTPVTVPLAVGEHFLTAGSPGFEPILEPLVVEPKGRQTTFLVPVPMSAQRYGDVFREVVTAYGKNRGNAHILVLAAMVTEIEEDFEGLLVRLPPEARNDPLLLLVESKWAHSRGDIPRSLALLGRALEAEDNLAALWRSRARILLHEGRHAEALADAEHAVHIEPLNARNFVTRGDAYLGLGKRYAARLDYEYALEMDPTNEAARLGLREAAREGS